MSNIQQAYHQATEAVLADYLAPELAHRVAQQIAERARPELQAAIEACIGIDLLPLPAARPKVHKRGKKSPAEKAMAPAMAGANDAAAPTAQAAP